MKWIQSSENPLIKEIKKIIKQPEERVFIEGINLIETAINSTNVQLEKILVTDSFIERHSEFFKTLQDKFSVIGISQKIAKEISDTVTPQGIFAMAKFKFSNINEIKKIPHLLLLQTEFRTPEILAQSFVPLKLLVQRQYYLLLEHAILFQARF